MFDVADLALIEIDPNATQRELRLVAEVRRLQEIVAKKARHASPDGFDALAYASSR